MTGFMRRVAPALALLAVLAALAAPPVTAGLGWCQKDPIVDIGGKRAHVWVSSPMEILDVVSGPTKVVIAVPEGVDTELIATDEGFGYGYNVRFVESDELRITGRGIEIEASAFVPSHGELPVRVEITDRKDNRLDLATGETNEWVTAAARL